MERDQLILKKQDELRRLLISNNIDISWWGINNAKTIENLWNEISKGESILQEAPLLRIVLVARVIIRRENKILVETEQKLQDGRIRSRYYLPSEKMKPDETYSEAAIRCLEEELGVQRGDVKVVESTHQETWEIKESTSYPGLCTKYIFHTVEAVVYGLPIEDFSTFEAIHNASDPVGRHHWAWVVEDRQLNTREK